MARKLVMADAGYEPRTTSRPLLWGRESYDEADGTRSFREKIDLLAPHGLSGTARRSKRGVPTLQGAHGKLAVGNALGLELAAFQGRRPQDRDQSTHPRSPDRLDNRVGARFPEVLGAAHLLFQLSIHPQSGFINVGSTRSPA